MADISMAYSAISGLKEKAEYLQSAFNDFLGDYDSMTGEILSNWEGTGRAEFESKCEALRPQMETISNSLGKYRTAIGQAVIAQMKKELDSAATIAKMAFGGF